MVSYLLIMKYYFSLQFKIFCRILQGQGIHIALFGLIIIVILFAAYHFLLTSNYTAYALLLFAIWGLEQLQTKERIEFLKTIFVERSHFISVRLLENTVIIFPLLAVTLIASIYWVVPILIVLYLIYSLQRYSLNIKSTSTLYTPYGKHPFEMIQFFRTNFSLICIASFLFIMGLLYDNQNLSLFGIALIPFFAINHLEKIEPIDIVWNYAYTPQRFLWYKIRRIILQIYAIITPLLITLLFFYYSSSLILIVFIIYLLIALLTILVLLMKYSIYPNRIGLIEGLVIGFCGLIPILVLGLYPYFYKKAILNLKKYLC